MAILRVKATGNGRKVNWDQLKKGSLVDVRGVNFALTTILTDVVADLVDLCQSLDSECRVVMIVPNGFTRAGYNLAILGKGFEVTCARCLVRGWFPFNPLAAEFGSNYDVVVTVGTADEEITNDILSLLYSKYECFVVAR
jgi:hypothetical protein